MPTFDVKVKDKTNQQEMTLQVTGADLADEAAAKKHVESMPGSKGGTHSGFEVLEVIDHAKKVTPAVAVTEVVATEAKLS